MNLPRLLCLLSLLLASPWIAAEGPAPAPTEPASVQPPAGQDLLTTTEQRLSEIRQQIAERRKEQDELKTRLPKERDEEQKALVKKRLEELPGIIESLSLTFEQTATGGIDFTVLEHQPPKTFDWKEELVLVAEPILAGLRSITEKPRKIEHLRAEILSKQQQLETIGKAEAAIAAITERKPPPAVQDRLAPLATKWAQKREDTLRSLEAYEYQISTLRGEAQSNWESVSESLKSFFAGRGLTLLVALAALLGVWLASRLLLGITRIVAARNVDRKQRYTRNRAVLYVYRISTVIFMAAALMAVFYVRSDLLLLAVTLVIAIMALMTLRQTLPRYIKEIRTLLDLGTVRVDERIVHDGIPFKVEAINAFAYLCNPDLEGKIRLPLESIAAMVSRPFGKEPWFPTHTGDFVVFSDGVIAEVLSQSIERVRLKVLNSVLEYPSGAFINMPFRNISRNGFALPITFGIDYRHQKDCLTTIPDELRTRLQQDLAKSDFAAHLQQVDVEFKAAGVNSLDYLIVLKLGGGAAASYRAMERFVQRSLVQLCNERDWIIPFSQLTVHRGDGF